jgi:hypothetical protein
MRSLKSFDYATLFHSCRTQGTLFDMEKNKGTSFLLYDKPQCSLLGLMVVGYDRSEVLSQMVSSLTFL